MLRAEIPRPTLTDLLALTALIAQKNLGHRGRVTTRWLQRWLESAPDAKINEAAFVVAALQALGSANHVRALEALRDVAERASGGPAGTRPRPPDTATPARRGPLDETMLAKVEQDEAGRSGELTRLSREKDLAAACSR